MKQVDFYREEVCQQLHISRETWGQIAKNTLLAIIIRNQESNRKIQINDITMNFDPFWHKARQSYYLNPFILYNMVFKTGNIFPNKPVIISGPHKADIKTFSSKAEWALKVNF